MDDLQTLSDDRALAEAAIARESIRHTMAVYNTAGDRGDFDAFVGSFAPDATFEVFGRHYRGHDEIRGFATAAPHREPTTDGRKPAVRHHTTTSRIDITSPTTASGWTYWIYLSNGALSSSGMYVDTFVKTGGRWLIASRRVKIDGE